MVRGKKLVLGVSGSIAAYKAVYLARLCVEAGAEVRPVLTAAATRFVGPLTFAAICGHRAITDLWSAASAGEIGHVELAHWADALVLAPATADLIARIAAGRADDPLCAIALATRAPLVIAPAMEAHMWSNPATAANLERLRHDAAPRVTVVEPAFGALASGREGVGRMAEPESILEAVKGTLARRDLAQVRVLVTAGPTHEALDPVRFLTNRSSGKMGYALARVAARRGALVHLVSGPTQLSAPDGVRLTRVTTTRQMLEACQQALPESDMLLMAAAPADYTPAQFSQSKIKKAPGPAGGSGLRVDFAATPDILTSLMGQTAGKVVVGFAAETGHLITHAREKLRRKHLDLIVANDVTRPEAGFAVDTNAVVILGADGTESSIAVMPKEQVADNVLDHARAVLSVKKPGSCPSP